MARVHLPRRSAIRVIPAVVLFAVTVVGLAACGNDEAPNRPGPALSSSAASRPGADRTAEQTLHMIDNAGHRLAFHVTEGHGPTIVLDSGGGEDSSYWKDIVPRLHAATGAKIIAYDRAGLGQSDAVPGAWQVEDAVSDLRTGLQKLGVTENVLLVAHSQAGEIATYFAKKNPGLVTGAVLVDASLPPLYTDEETARLAAANQPAVDAAKKHPTEPRNRQLISLAESYVPLHEAYHRATWPDTIPATVIVSEKTPFDGSPEDARRWRDAAAAFVRQGPDRTLVTAAGSSHDIPKDRPTLVLEEIEKIARATG